MALYCSQGLHAEMKLNITGDYPKVLSDFPKKNYQNIRNVEQNTWLSYISL